MDVLTTFNLFYLIDLCAHLSDGGAKIISHSCSLFFSFVEIRSVVFGMLLEGSLENHKFSQVIWEPRTSRPDTVEIFDE